MFDFMLDVLDTILTTEGSLVDIPREDAALFAEGLDAPEEDGVTCADIAEGFRSLTEDQFDELCAFIENGTWALDPDVVEKCYQHQPERP